jgi:hypothetical protein
MNEPVLSLQTYFAWGGPLRLLAACALIGLVGWFFTRPWFGK